MGVRDFFKFLASIGYRPDQGFFVSVKHKLIVDVKNMMYRFAYHVPIDDANFAQSVATAIRGAFETFEHVTLVNDGTIDESHPKFQTATKRSETRKAAVVKTNKRKAELSARDDVVDEKELQKLDRSERAARGVSFEQSKAIFEILSTHSNFQCVQCDGEADEYIIKHHTEFDFVVSEDSDFIIGGVTCLLRGIGTRAQAVYRTQDVLDCLELSLRQLQELSAMAGNDYTILGIRGMGLLKAHALLLNYGSCKDMLSQWTPSEHRHFLVSDEFYSAFNQSMLTYSDQNTPYLLDVPQPKPESKPIVETKLKKEEPRQKEFFDIFLKKCKHQTQ